MEIKENDSKTGINTIKIRKLRLRRKYRKLIFWVLVFIFISIFLFSTYNILMWNIDNNKLKTIENDLIEKTEINVVDTQIDDENTIIVNEPTEKTDIYWKYISTSMIDVDVEKLKKENKDAVGWIQVLGTNINYPMVQTSNNDYYLNHDFLGNYNRGGWIFLDYRNDIENLNVNNIIYGHRRTNESMFGTLKNVLSNEWFDDTDNHIIKVSTLNYNYLFQIFSVYSVPNEAYYLQTEFASSAAHTEFLNTIVNRSIYDFNTEVNQEARVLTLSTCHNNSDRLVVHAKLIKINQKVS